MTGQLIKYYKVPVDELTAAPSVYLKEISSDGNLNTIDILFQTWPAFASLNPEYIKLFLQPVLSYLNLPKAEGWPHPWVIHDLGTRKTPLQSFALQSFSFQNSSLC